MDEQGLSVEPMTVFGQVMPVFEENRLPPSFVHLLLHVAEALRQGVADESVVDAGAAPKPRTPPLNGECRKGKTDCDGPDIAAVARADDTSVLFGESPLRGHAVAPARLDPAPVSRERRK